MTLSPAETGLLAPLRNRQFALLWLAATVSTLGEFLYAVGASWLAYELTHSTMWTGLVASARLLPIILLAPLTGVFADRFDRRRILLAAHLVMAVASGALALLTARGAIGLVTLLAVILLLGFGTAVNHPAWSAFVPDIVPAAQLRSALSLEAAVVSVSSMLGPPLAGLLIVAGGAQSTFALNAASYLPVAVVIVLLPTIRHAGPRPRMWAALSEGLAVARQRGYLRLFVPLASAATVSGVVQAVLPELVTHRLHGTGSTFGLLYGVSGAGTVVGALAVRRHLGRWLGDRLVPACLAGSGAALLALGSATGPWLAGLAMFLAGVFGVCCQITLQSRAQLAVEARYRGRVMALYSMVFLTALSGGSVVAGALSSLLGSVTVVLVSGLAVLAVAARLWQVPSPA